MSVHNSNSPQQPPILCRNFANSGNPRGWITSGAASSPSGELKRLVDEDGLGGVTSNPAIFEKAITGSTDYADALVELQKRKDLDAMGVYEILAIKDIQDAADMLRPVYDRTKMRDGYVSLEVSPFLANDTRRHASKTRAGLWKAVNRPNLHGEGAGARWKAFPPSSSCISEGINVNVTLLFAQEMYEKVALAYIAGLKKYVAAGGDPQPCGQRRQLFHQPHRQHGGFHREGQAESRAPIRRSRRC